MNALRLRVSQIDVDLRLAMDVADYARVADGKRLMDTRHTNPIEGACGLLVLVAMSGMPALNLTTDSAHLEVPVRGAF